MQRPILLVIDMLNDFLEKWDRSSRGSLVSSVNELVATMRKASRPVVWVRQEFEPDLSDAYPEMRAKNIRIAIKGTTGAQMHPHLAADPFDLAIVKKRYSAFFGTSLDDFLRQMQPDSLVLAGINTHACIRATAIDAYQRDWPVILATDCVDSYDSEHHDVTLRYLKDKIATLRTNQEIEAMLNPKTE
jgi:nicotinamidase-related amidase